MIRDLRSVVVGRLSPWRVVTGRSAVTDATLPVPYVVVDFPNPRREQERWAAHNQGRLSGWWQTACVGETNDQAGELADRVIDLYLDWVPTFPGWNVWPVEMDTDPRLLPWDVSIPDRSLVQVVTRWKWVAERTV